MHPFSVGEKRKKGKGGNGRERKGTRPSCRSVFLSGKRGKRRRVGEKRKSAKALQLRNRSKRGGGGKKKGETKGKERKKKRHLERPPLRGGTREKRRV